MKIFINIRCFLFFLYLTQIGAMTSKRFKVKNTFPNQRHHHSDEISNIPKSFFLDYFATNTLSKKKVNSNLNKNEPKHNMNDNKLPLISEPPQESFIVNDNHFERINMNNIQPDDSNPNGGGKNVNHGAHDQHNHHNHKHTQPAVTHIDFIRNIKIIENTDTSGDLLLSFNAYNTSFFVKLERNLEFSLKGAMLLVFDGRDSRSKQWETSLSSTHVYKGILVDQLGNPVVDSYARIVIQDRNAFIMDGIISCPTMGMFHIKHIPVYQRAKRDIDVGIETLETLPDQSNSILIRDLDPKQMICARKTGSHSTDQSSSNGCARRDIQQDSSNGTLNLMKRDLKDSEQMTCGVKFQDFRLNALYKNMLNGPKGSPNTHIFKRQQACPLANKKILAMGVAADCSYVVEKGGISETLTSILSNWNQASAVFESTFNVQLGVIRVSIQATCTPLDTSLAWNRDCSVPSYTISNRLSDFSKWRGERSEDGVGLWHLMTKCSTQPAVGIAWVSQLCQTKMQSQGTQSVSGTGVSSIVPIEWKVVAHEIAHGFGAIHDCSSAGCDDSCRSCQPSCDCKSQYLMNPLDNSVSSAFSPSSIKDICQGIVNMGSCLQNPGSLSLVEAGVCGNAIKEGNEQCDCGDPNGEACKNNPCCDGKTCTLKPGKQCDPRNDACCSNTCEILAATTVCHKGDDICDKTVNCPGNSATCPFKTFIEDGTQCKRPDGISATCSSGICTSRDMQCNGTSSAVTTVSACPAFGNDCSLNCQDRNGNCFQLTGNFLDGTTCGGIGRCMKGKCAGSTIFSQAMLWIQTFPQYAYPIIILFVILILIIIFGFVRRYMYARSRKGVKRGKGGGIMVPIPGTNQQGGNPSSLENSAKKNSSKTLKSDIPDTKIQHQNDIIALQQKEEQLKLKKLYEEQKLKKQKTELPTPEIEKVKQGQQAEQEYMVDFEYQQQMEIQQQLEYQQQIESQQQHERQLQAKQEQEYQRQQQLEHQRQQQAQQQLEQQRQQQVQQQLEQQRQQQAQQQLEQQRQQQSQQQLEQQRQQQVQQQLEIPRQQQEKQKQQEYQRIAEQQRLQYQKEIDQKQQIEYQKQLEIKAQNEQQKRMEYQQKKQQALAQQQAQQQAQQFAQQQAQQYQAQQQAQQLAQQQAQQLAQQQQYQAQQPQYYQGHPQQYHAQQYQAQQYQAKHQQYYQGQPQQLPPQTLQPSQQYYSPYPAAKSPSNHQDSNGRKGKAFTSDPFATSVPSPSGCVSASEIPAVGEKKKKKKSKKKSEKKEAKDEVEKDEPKKKKGKGKGKKSKKKSKKNEPGFVSATDGFESSYSAFV